MDREAMGRGRRALVVDADPDARRTTVAFMRKAGFDVAEAEDGDRALAALATPGLGVLVADRAMPDADRTRLMLRVREVCPGLAALIVTGYAGPSGPSGLPAGMAILREPFRRRSLAQLLAALGTIEGFVGATVARS